MDKDLGILFGYMLASEDTRRHSYIQLNEERNKVMGESGRIESFLKKLSYVLRRCGKGLRQNLYCKRIWHDAFVLYIVH